MVDFYINPAKHRHPGYILAAEFIEEHLKKFVIKGVHFGSGWDESLNELSTLTEDEASFTIDRLGNKRFVITAVDGSGFRGTVDVTCAPTEFPKETVVEFLRMDGTKQLCLEELLLHYNAVAGKGRKLTTGAVKDFEYRDDKAVITLSKYHPSATEDTQIVLKLVNLCD